jgi:hypothetical protein
MPMYNLKEDIPGIGIRKVWKRELEGDECFSFIYFLRTLVTDEPGGGLYFDSSVYGIQCLICIIIAIILMQSDIFSSYGYKKFVTQEDGSMDLLV